ncbi:MAG: hypothetical protein ABR562_00565 [Thermoplasmatota archaeon]|nr:hypothetical protein [Halobacteriales archaeon]
MRIPLAILAIALLAPAARAADACTQADPCTWIVDVDGRGIYAGDAAPSFNATVGDWFVLNGTNMDEAFVAHTLSLDGYGVVLSLGPAEEAQTAPFQLTRVGTFSLHDERGRSGTVVVTKTDVNDQAAGLTATSAATPAGAPAPALVLVAVALLGLAAVRRA